MNDLHYYLELLQQECNEVGQRCSKAKIFGTEEIQADQNLTNAERLNQEYNDILAVVEVLNTLGLSLERDEKMIEKKKAKMHHFRQYALKVNPDGN